MFVREFQLDFGPARGDTLLRRGQSLWEEDVYIKDLPPIWSVRLRVSNRSTIKKNVFRAQPA